MAKRKQATGAPAPVVTAKAPKGAVRVLVRVRRTGRTMRMSSGEARALSALKVVEYVEPAPVVVPKPYLRRDMVAQQPFVGASGPEVVVPPFFVVKKGDGEA